MMHIKLEDIGLYRVGSDIDIDAIFGGHISGRRLRGVKMNPLFHDSHLDDSDSDMGESAEDGKLSMDGIEIKVYESLPRPNGRTNIIHKTLNDLPQHEQKSKSQNRKRLKHHAFVHHTDSSEQCTQNDLSKTGETNLAYISDTDSEVTCNKNEIRDSKSMNNDDVLSTANKVENNSYLLKDDASWQDKNILKHVLEYSEDGETHMSDLLSSSDGSEWPDMDELALAADDESSSYNGTQATNTNRRYAKRKLVRPIIHSLGASSCDEGSSVLTHERKKSTHSSGSEQKSVTFSQDTIFNENKTKRYKKEKMNLREMYRGKISYDTAVAKLNPVFVDDDEEEEVHVQTQVRDHSGTLLTDDEKAARYFSSVTHEDKIDGSCNILKNGVIDHLVDLNTPSYMQKILSQSSSSLMDSHRSLSSQRSSGSVASGEEKIEDAPLPDGIVDVPGYNTLIRKTIMEERRKRICKVIVCVLVMVIALGSIIGLGVYFGMGNVSGV